MLLQTARYMSIGFNGSDLVLGFGSIISTITDEDKKNIYLNLLGYWTEPKTTEDVTQYLLDKGFAAEVVKEVINDAINKSYIIDKDYYNRDNQYSRNHLFYSFLGRNPHQVQERLEQKKVVILGCGGIGNLVGISLATAGVKELILVDDDKVELSNLNRQFMFTKKDIGQYKTKSLQKALLERNDNISIQTYEQRASLELMQSIGKVDLIVLSADSSDCLPMINKYCVANKIAYINIGYVQDIAVWGPFYIPGKTGCFYCQNNIYGIDVENTEARDLARSVNARYQPPSNAAVNMLASSLGYLDILKYLGEFGEIHSIDKRIGLWTHNLEIEKQDCHASESCKICANQ